MRELIKRSLLAWIIFSSPSIKAEDFIRLFKPWGDQIFLQSVNFQSGEVTDLANFNNSGLSDGDYNGTSFNVNNFNLGSFAFTDEYEGKYYIQAKENSTNFFMVFDYETKSIEKVTNIPWEQTYTREYFSGTSTSNVQPQLLSPIPNSIKSLIKKNEDGSIQIGSDANDIDLTSEGMSVGGSNLIKKQSNGIISIGKNSFKMQETSTQMKLWATDSNGRIAPINITNGTKFLINGRDVEQSINNVGALSAALTGLPKVPTDTTLSCGLGTGTHGGDFAFSGGCASKVNEKLSINYAASMTMPGQDYAGDFKDTFSARAGFIWKLGKATKPTQISMKDKKVMETKIELLEKRNKTILSKNQKLENKLSILMARLEKIEKIALGGSKSKDLAVYKLK